ncbi:hypothetical protein KORDIASMS9_01114 [Kordia sp. SMS9]|uniref:hypothetical protein n=1 Tax=Kordia sp. SMS9 TaxID=2282170 RepID=UPI000E0CF49D|nr:hypothetical protein [Kordia sp. SMS9]AXG68896.1 hypothetical protein KORDIASMS9_01114 [Kordia sp. SMS9]
MKRVYKVILLFVTIFVTGVLSFGSYINSSLKTKNDFRDDIRAVEVPQDSIKNAAIDAYYLN